ncbi:LacI family transcriptional regulator, partial [Escherichia coli]|nr:LacI family transcriptional regulator [Escherichia coli]
MATLADVAKAANVSKMTVSRVLNHPDQVSDELKNLVYQAMADLNYQPNRLARALVNQQTQMIKLMILEDTDSVEPYY